MSLLDRRPRCDCCSNLRQFIGRHLDPDGTFYNSEDPAEVVEGFDCVSDGDCGVTVDEMKEYMVELPLRPWQIEEAV
jgi:hypothetical protein